MNDVQDRNKYNISKSCQSMRKIVSSESIIDLISMQSTSTVKMSTCHCRQDNQFYSAQRQMILATTQNLDRQSESDSLTIGLLGQMLKYIDKIDSFGRGQCSCKKDTEITRLKASNQFLKTENQKIFSLLEEKNEECDALKKQLCRHDRSVDIESYTPGAHSNIKPFHSDYFKQPLKDCTRNFENIR